MEIQTVQIDFYVETGIPKDTFQVIDFKGVEQLSKPFRFDINLASYDPEITLADISNQPATLTIHLGSHEVSFHGMVADFEQGPHVADRYSYRAVLIPPLWYLSMQFQCRVFTELNVEEIVSKVLQDAGLNTQQFRFDLGSSYPTREYVAQYNETDLNFVSRLCEHWGIYFYFEGGVVVFTDGKTGLPPPIEGGGALIYNPGGGLQAAAEAVRAFNCREQLVRGQVLLMDYNYRTSMPEIEAESRINADMPGKHYEFGQHFLTTEEALLLAKVRNEEIECQRRVMSGESGYVGMRVGHTFSLKRHFRNHLDGDYLLTHIHHEGEQGASIPGMMGRKGQKSNVYSNAFRCIPANVAYRPPREARVPKIPGIMSAAIEKPGGDYAHLDEEGRYRAKMYFDAGWSTARGERTHWIRMKQAYSGANYGIHFPNHAETEMIWACIDGNPDRPMALGTVPNALQKSPARSENNWQNVIRTWGQNELTFDDMKGEENIYLFATKDRTTKVTNNHSENVGNDQSMDVGHDRTRTVGNNESITVGVDQAISIGANQTESIGTNQELTVGANRTKSVGDNESNTIGTNQSTTVGANMTLDIGNNRTQTIGKDDALTIGDNLTVEVGKDGEIVIGKKLKIQSGDDLTITGGKKAVIDVADQLTIKCGSASIILKSSGDIEIKGKKINMKASGDIKMKGSKIAQN